MKTMITTTLALMLTVLTGLALGQNVSVTDYDVAVSRAKDLRLDLDYSFAAQGDSTITDQGNGSVAMKTFYSSLPLAWSFDATGITSENRGNFTALADMSGRFKKFLQEDKDFFAGAQVDMTYGSEYDALGRDEPRTDVTAIAGYGRFVDASPLAKAVRIEEFLIKERILTGNMSKESMLELAYLIEKEAQYKDQHGATYKTQWYADMEKVMQESGKLRSQGLGGVGTLRVDEVLFRENVQNRFYGYDVTVGVGVTATTPDTTKKRGDGVATLGFRWSRPVAWKSQIDQQLSIRTVLDSDFGKELNGVLTTRYIYELSNRIDFSVAHILNYQKAAEAGPDGDDDAADNTVRLSFLFYLENYINLTANLGFNKLEDEDLITTFFLGLGVDVW